MLENEIKELTAAVRENTETMKVMIAGREEALAALQADAKGSPGGTTTTTRTRSKKADTVAAEPAATAAPSWNPDLSADGLRKLVAPYLGAEDPAVKKSNSDNVRAVLAHLGVDTINPIPAKPEAKALEGDEARRQAAFYITRFAEGLKVDFSADYDFGSDPCSQGDVEPAAPVEDDLLG